MSDIGKWQSVVLLKGCGMRQRPSVLAALLLSALAAPCLGQWRAIDLCPVDYPGYDSTVVCGDGAIQIGSTVGLTNFFFVCHGNQCPPYHLSLGIEGCSQNQMVGSQYAGSDQSGSVFHAFVQTYAGGWTDLHPSGFRSSIAYDCDNGMQVGIAEVLFRLHAILWRGSSAGVIDLNPSGYDESQAFGIRGAEQVGIVYPPNDQAHAALWHGTAESFVDLHPAGALWSHAYATSGNEQVGLVVMADSPAIQRASLWRGSPESWVDLHPAPSRQSRAMWADLQYQVGWFTSGVSDWHKAAAWAGTPESMIDLHAFLPADYEQSEAHVVGHDDSFVYVSGWAENASGRHAMLWVRPRFTECWSDWNQDGFVNGDDFDFFADAFESGNEAADFNRDYFVNGDDFDQFAEHFEEGC